jgi:hypothetical protein
MKKVSPTVSVATKMTGSRTLLENPWMNTVFVSSMQSRLIGQ